MIKERVRSGFGCHLDVGVPKQVKCDLPPSYADAAASRAPPDVVDHFKKIDCNKCGVPFSPAMKQFQKFEELQIPLPDRCPKCKGQACDKFKEDGAWPYGDACKFLHQTGDHEAAVVPAASGDVPKHSYSCRFFAAGHCMSGDKCRFQHGPRKEPGTVHSISEVDPSVFNISEAESSIQDDPFVEKSKIESNRFSYTTKVDASEYRYF